MALPSHCVISRNTAFPRISHEKTQQSANGVVAFLEAKAEGDSAEDEVQIEDDAAEENGDEDGDESDDVRPCLLTSCIPICEPAF